MDVNVNNVAHDKYGTVDGNKKTNFLNDFIVLVKEHLDPLAAVSNLDPGSDMKNRKLAQLQASLDSKESWSLLAMVVSAIALIVICCLPPVSVGAAIAVGLILAASFVVNSLCASSKEALQSQAANHMHERIDYLMRTRFRH